MPKGELFSDMVSAAPGCRSIAPCGTCYTCRVIKAMPPWTPDQPACVGFADCPCHGCRARRQVATADHPNHTATADQRATGRDLSYCGRCIAEDRDAHDSRHPSRGAR